MKTAILLGTGTVGRAIAARLAEFGHTVTIGTRDPETTLARTERDAMGTASFAAWVAENPGITLAGFADAAVGAEIIVNATNGSTSLDVLAQSRAENLDGKIILDIANPLDFSNGMPRGTAKDPEDTFRFAALTGVPHDRNLPAGEGRGRLRPCPPRTRAPTVLPHRSIPLLPLGPDL